MPSAVLVGAAAALAWHERGSIDASDWLPYAVFGAYLLAAVVAAQFLVTVPRPSWMAAGALFALAIWQGVSLTWSAVPALARDEALLTSLFGVCFLVSLLTLRRRTERMLAIGAVVLASAATAVVVGLQIWLGSNPSDLFPDGRLSFPISYWNAQAAFFLVAFWPAIVLAAQRPLHVALRSCALGAACSLLAGWLLVQSRGGALALAISAVALFALAPGRMRLLVPTAATVLVVAPASVALTAPFRADGTAERASAATQAGLVLLIVTGVGALVGTCYATIDRRGEVPPRVRSTLAVVVAGAIAATVAVAAGLLLANHPLRLIETKWESFKVKPETETQPTHLLTIGSSRYDLWRVALDESEQHPWAGIGARGFGPAYLEHRRTNETPARAHSLFLDVLAETGVIGLILLLGALLPPLVLAVPRLGEPAVAAAFGGGIYWLTHASFDWVWTLPAVGIPFFVLLGVAAGGREPQPIVPRLSMIIGIGVVLAALLLYTPPWLSSRYTARAYADPASSETYLDYARILDPLSVEPLVAESRLAPPGAAVRPLEQAVRKQPRSAGLWYLLGTAYLNARRPADAREALLVADRLFPRSREIRAALARAQRP